MSRARSTKVLIQGQMPHDLFEAAHKRSEFSCPPFIKGRSHEIYSDAEQHFSSYAHWQLLRLLSGKEDRFRLMRHYYDANEIAFFLPSRLDKNQIRVRVAEDIIYGVLRFLQPIGMGGPIVQRTKDDCITESQLFPTRYPHLVVKRQDRYEKRDSRHTEVEWHVMCIHGKQKSAVLNQTLELGKLVIDIAKFFSIL